MGRLVDQKVGSLCTITLALPRLIRLSVLPDCSRLEFVPDCQVVRLAHLLQHLARLERVADGNKIAVPDCRSCRVGHALTAQFELQQLKLDLELELEVEELELELQ